MTFPGVAVGVLRLLSHHNLLSTTDVNATGQVVEARANVLALYGEDTLVGSPDGGDAAYRCGSLLCKLI